MDLQRFNLIDPEDKMYPINKQDRIYKPHIKVYFTDHDDVIITGACALQGVWWLSVTNISEADEIRNVFNYVSKLEPAECANIHSVIRRTNYTDEQLRYFYYTFPQTADDIFDYYHRIEISILEQEKGGKYYEIQKYDLMTPIKPNYMPDPRDRLIKAYYGNDSDVIIVGVADNCYIYWFSVTKMDDAETNRMILEWLNLCIPTKFGHGYIAVKKTQYTYEQIKSFYCADIKNADDIIKQKKNASEKSRKLNDDGDLIQQLRRYRKRLSNCSGDARKDYARHKNLIRKIEAKSYLRGSDDPKVRELYNEVDRLCSHIYNAYMTEVR